MLDAFNLPHRESPIASYSRGMQMEGVRGAEPIGDYFSNSANSQTRANLQCLSTVSSDTFKTAADSAALRPPKKAQFHHLSFAQIDLR
jgi:hypothetical protein